MSEDEKMFAVMVAAIVIALITTLAAFLGWSVAYDLYKQLISC